jgi:hypothetical protein
MVFLKKYGCGQGQPARTLALIDIHFSFPEQLLRSE